MSTDSRAGTRATAADLVDVEKLLAAYYDGHPDPSDPLQAVAFGTSRHRGLSLSTTFNDDHIAATSQASSTAPGKARTGRCSSARTRTLSGPAGETCVESTGGGRRRRAGDAAGGYPHPGGVARDPRPQPQPRYRHRGGIIITPSQPAAGRWLNATRRRGRRHGRDEVDRRAGRELLAAKLDGVRRRSVERSGWARTTSSAATSTTCGGEPRRDPQCGVRISADPMSGASVAYWGVIAGGTASTSPSSIRRGSPIRVHDAGLGRQDPHGLLVAVRDGLAGRAPRAVPDRR